MQWEIKKFVWLTLFQYSLSWCLDSYLQYLQGMYVYIFYVFIIYVYAYMYDI